MKSRKAEPIQPCTASTRARSALGRFVPKPATSAPKKERISTHRSIEPSWFPHTPVILKRSGCAELLFSKTFRTEKSEVTCAVTSAAKAIATKPKPTIGVVLKRRRAARRASGCRAAARSTG